VMSTDSHSSDRAARARITAAMDGDATGELRAFRGRGRPERWARSASSGDRVQPVHSRGPSFPAVRHPWPYLQRHAPALVLVANKLDGSSRLDVDALGRQIPFARGIVGIPTAAQGPSSYTPTLRLEATAQRLDDTLPAARRTAHQRLATPEHRPIASIPDRPAGVAGTLGCARGWGYR
jgi:hypothetical protein